MFRLPIRTYRQPSLCLPCAPWLHALAVRPLVRSKPRPSPETHYPALPACPVDGRIAKGTHEPPPPPMPSHGIPHALLRSGSLLSILKTASPAIPKPFPMPSPEPSPMPSPKPFPMPSPQHSVTQSPIAQLDTDTESQHLYGIITHPKSKPITTWRRGLDSTPWAKSLILRKRLIAARCDAPAAPEACDTTHQPTCPALPIGGVA